MNREESGVNVVSKAIPKTSSINVDIMMVSDEELELITQFIGKASTVLEHKKRAIPII